MVGFVVDGGGPAACLCGFLCGTVFVGTRLRWISYILNFLFGGVVSLVGKCRRAHNTRFVNFQVFHFFDCRMHLNHCVRARLLGRQQNLAPYRCVCTARAPSASTTTVTPCLVKTFDLVLDIKTTIIAFDSIPIRKTSNRYGFDA